MFLLSGTIALAMLFCNTLLCVAGHSWTAWQSIRILPISPMSCPPPKPPNKPHKSRSVVTNCHKLLLTAFALLNQANGHSTGLALTSETRTGDSLQRHRDCHGMLSTRNLDKTALEDLQHTIWLDTSGFHSVMSSHDTVPQAIIDTGASNSCTPDASDFVPGTLRRPDKPTQIGGIAGDIPVHCEGILKWETLDDCGQVIEFHATGFLAPGLPTRLFSPQSFLDKCDLEEAHFRVFRDRTKWHKNGRKQCAIPHDRNTFLPEIVLFRDRSTEKTLKAMAGCISAETCQNLTPFKRHWLRWHFKLGHLGFNLVRDLGISGFLDSAAMTLHRSMPSSAAVPKCAACQFGKQTRRPDGTTHVQKKNAGALKRDVLQPGQLTFLDHSESAERGRLLSSAK